MVKLPSLSTLILLHVLPALLPQAPEHEKSYYEVLKVTKSASQEDIRKAFRKISLQLHPDKLQQRGLDPKDYEAEYQLVQEAYGVLSDKKKRNEYNNLGDSPSRYQFVASGNLYNPMCLMENLMKADSNAKTRIMMLVAVIVAVILLQPILICAKINQLFDGGALESTPWMLLLIPTWILQGIFCFILLGVLFFAEEKSQLLLNFLGNVCWFIGMILLALRWDRTIDFGYTLVFIPFYIYLGTRFASYLLTMHQINQQVQMMVTLSALEEVLGKPLSELDEEERTAIEEEYVIVHLPPHVTGTATVEDSPEYQAAIEYYYDFNARLIKGIFFEIPLVVLIVLKVDGTLNNTNWWLIFLPVWIHLFLKSIYNFYTCCWAVGNQVIVGHMEEDIEEAAAPPREEEATSSALMYVPPDAHDATDFTKIPMLKKEGDPSVAISEDGHVSSNEGSATPADAALPSTEMLATLEKFDNEFSPPMRKFEKPTSKEPNPSHPDIEPTSLDFATEAGEESTLDPEIFAEWQQSYQEAQASAHEAQLKAQGSCCNLMVQFMMLSLIVGKLEQAYSESSGGFNAIWILFPIFVFAGCTLMCCAFLIYSREGDDMNEVFAGDTSKGETKEGDKDGPTDGKSGLTSLTPAAMELPELVEPIAPVATPAPTRFDADELD